MVERYPVAAGARRIRQRTARFVAVVLAVVVLLAGWIATASAACRVRRERRESPANVRESEGPRLMWSRRRARATDARRSRRGAARLVLCLAGTVVLGLGGTTQAAAGPFSATTANGTNTFTAGILAAPTTLAVSQACVVDPMPTRRSPGGSSFTSGDNSRTLTIARPTGAQVGDLLIASISWDNNATITDGSNPPWTPIFNPQLKDADLAQSVYYRKVTASEPSSYSWTGGSEPAAGGIVAYSGVDQVVPVNASSGQISSDKVAPSLTTTRAKVRLVGLWAVVGAHAPSVPTGMTQIWNGVSNGVGGAALQVTSVGADEPWPTLGATGSRALTGSGSKSISQLVALQPPAWPHATTTWTGSTSTYATGQVYRRSSAGTVQRQETLSASTTSQTDGPLTSGTGYTVVVTATYANWRSTETAASFSAITC